jgi:hypothetical protein
MIDPKHKTLEELIVEGKARGPMSEEEWAAQRASFVRGEISTGSDRDEAAYREAVRSGDTATKARLDREAEERVKRAFR